MITKRTNALLTLVAAVLLLGGVACGSTKVAEPVEPTADKAAAPAEDKAGAVKDAPAKAADKAEAPAAAIYTFETPDVAIKVGETGQAAIKVKPAEGYKINEAYPWKAEMSAPDNLGLTEVKVGKDKWALSKGLASLSFPVEAKAAGDGEITAKLKFSICNEDKCELLKKDVTLKVAAK